MQGQPESINKLRYNILGCTCKILCMKPKLASLTSSSAFFLQPKVKVYIFGSVTIHLLDINTVSIEFQSNSTRLKLMSRAGI